MPAKTDEPASVGDGSQPAGEFLVGSLPSVSTSSCAASSYKRERKQRQTQCDRILALLRSANGDWVALPRILPLAAQYGSRVWSLRRAGHLIENRTEWHDGKRCSWFRLLEQPGLFPEEKTP